MSFTFLPGGLWAPTGCIDNGLGTIAFELPFTPKAWSRTFPVKRGRFVKMVEEPEQREAKGNIIAFANQHAPPRPLLGPVALTGDFVLVPPSKWTREHREVRRGMPTGSPDLDNLLKLVKDALTASGRFYRDDAQVVSLAARKRYGPDPKSLITVGPA